MVLGLFYCVLGLLLFCFTTGISLVITLPLWMLVSFCNVFPLLPVLVVLLTILWLAACFGFLCSFSSSEILLVLRKLLHTVKAYFHVVYSFLLSILSFLLLHLIHQSMFTLAVHYHFPSKTLTSLCLHDICSSSLKICHLCEKILNMHLSFFWSYPLLSFLLIYSQLDLMLVLRLPTI